MKKGNMVKGLGLVLVGMLMLGGCWNGCENKEKQEKVSDVETVISDSLQNAINNYSNSSPSAIADSTIKLTAIPTAIAQSFLQKYNVAGATRSIVIKHVPNHQDIIYASRANMLSLKTAATTAGYTHIVMSLAKMTSALKTLIANNNSYQVGQLYFVFRFCNLGAGQSLLVEPNKSYLICGTSALQAYTSGLPGNPHSTIMMTAINKYLGDLQPKSALDSYCVAGPAIKPEVTDTYYSLVQLNSFIAHGDSVSQATGVAFNNIGIAFSENSATTGDRARRFEFLHMAYSGSVPLAGANYFDYASSKP
jgi:hypothetical protein